MKRGHRLLGGSGNRSWRMLARSENDLVAARPRVQDPSKATIRVTPDLQLDAAHMRVGFQGIPLMAPLRQPATLPAEGFADAYAAGDTAGVGGVLHIEQGASIWARLPHYTWLRKFSRTSSCGQPVWQVFVTILQRKLLTGSFSAQTVSFGCPGRKTM